MTDILFVPCQSAVPFLRWSYFRLWPWNFNSKVKVMGVVKGQGHTICPVSNQINSPRFHFTSIRPTIPEIELFRNLTLKHPRSRSWVRSKVNVTYCTQYPNNALPFRFTSIGPTIPEIWPKMVFDLEKHIRIFYRKFDKIKVSNRTPPKSNQVINMTRAIKLSFFVVIRWVVLTLSCRQTNFC